MRRYDWEGGLVEDLSNELEDVEDCFDASKEHDGGKKLRVYLGERGDAGGYLCTCRQSQPLGRLVVWLVEIEIIQPSKRVGGNTTRTRCGAQSGPEPSGQPGRLVTARLLTARPLQCYLTRETFGRSDQHHILHGDFKIA